MNHDPDWLELSGDALCLTEDEFECTACSFYETKWCWVAPSVPSANSNVGGILRLEPIATGEHRWPIPWGTPAAQPVTPIASAEAILEQLAVPLHVDLVIDVLQDAGTSVHVNRAALIRELRSSRSVEETGAGTLVFRPWMARRAPRGGDHANVEVADRSRLSALEQMLDGAPPADLDRDDEFRLARAVELGRFAGTLIAEADPVTRNERDIALLRPVIAALVEYLDLPVHQPDAARFSSPRFRRSIDHLLDDGVLAHISGQLGISPESARGRLVRASALTELWLDLHRELDENDLESDVLTKRVREGLSALTLMTERNLRLVIWIARRTRRSSLTWEDVIQEGAIGLMSAVEKFDYRRGTKFSTYATWWIRQRISRAIREDSRLVRVPSHVWDQHPLEEGELEGVLRDPASLDEISHRIPHTILVDMLPATEGDSPAAIAEEGALTADLEVALESLSLRQRKVLELRFGLNDGVTRTLEEVGQEFGVTRERIRQIEAKALKVLRTPKHAMRLREYLPDDKRSEHDSTLSSDPKKAIPIQRVGGRNRVLPGTLGHRVRPPGVVAGVSQVDASAGPEGQGSPQATA